VLSRSKTLGVRRSPDCGLSADLGDLSAVRGACGGVPLAGLAEAGLLALPPLGVGGVTLPLLPSAAADLRPKSRNFCSDQESNNATYKDLQPKQRILSWNQRDRCLLRPGSQHLLRLPWPLSVTPNGMVGSVGARLGGKKQSVRRCWSL